MQVRATLVVPGWNFKPSKSIGRWPGPVVWEQGLALAAVGIVLLAGGGTSREQGGGKNNHQEPTAYFHG